MSNELSDLLAMMTPEERAQYDTIQAAAAANLLTAAERANIGQRPNDPGWSQFVADVRGRLAASQRKIEKLQ